MHLAENQHAVSQRASQLSTIGEAVLPLLKSNSTGIVAARFERSAYLEFNTEWVCLALPSLGAGPSVLQLHSESTELHAAVQVGAQVTFDAHRYLRIGDYTIDINGARAYSGMLTTHHINRQRVYRWNQVFQENTLSYGLASLLGHLELSTLSAKPWNAFTELTSVQNETAQSERSPVDVHANELLAYVAPPMQALLNWVHDVAALDIHTEPPLVITKLLGAGPGLTPSGDDYLAGVLCALHMNGNQQAIQLLRSVLLSHAHQSTTPVSVSLLKQACDGRINEHAQQLVHCVLLSSDVDAAALQGSIQCMGASSGWDFLTGLVFGVLACDV